MAFLNWVIKFDSVLPENLESNLSPVDRLAEPQQDWWLRLGSPS
jgi:hypothetical protein